MPSIKEPKMFTMRGINTNLSNRLDHNDLTSNIQNGDINSERTENINTDENIQKSSTMIHNVEGDVHFHIGQGLNGGSAMQDPKSNNYLTTDHALSILFALIGLACVAIAIGIAVSCCLKNKKRKKKTEADKIQQHKEISQSQRELHILQEIQTLKTNMLKAEGQKDSREDKIEDIRRAPDGFAEIYPSLSDVSEI